MAKYTAEQTARAVKMYAEKGNPGLDEIAAALGEDFSKRSVISKLVKEGVYVKDEKPAPAPRDPGPTKADLMADMAEKGFNTEGLQGATRDALIRVLNLVKGATE